ncbi:MAG: PRC-barrel domain-containing protein [Gordonibacter sp.]|nr:PRC-barrel domain-containing protein [Gordonibacter sp.]
MTKHLITTNELSGVRVVGGKKGTRRIGKVRRFVFHPKEKRIIGFMVKRPDLLWMFRRKDMFVAIDGYDVVDGRLVVKLDSVATDYRATCKALGVSWDDCVLWVGLPVITEDGDNLGIVGTVAFDNRTGTVEHLITDSGAAANALLGRREIPAGLVKGFRRGMGAALAQAGSEVLDGDEAVLGAIMVDNEAKNLTTEGGLAEKAGEATAVVADKAQTAIDKAKPVVSNAAKVTGEAVNKGAYATGKQIAATKGMFSGFKDEYSKASGKKQSDSMAVERSGKAPASTSVKKTSTKKSVPTQKTAAVKKQPSKKSVSQKNMFSAFKEEYDKARNDD